MGPTPYCIARILFFKFHSLMSPEMCLDHGLLALHMESSTIKERRFAFNLAATRCRLMVLLDNI